jgi:Family of unknown function (DUF5343)
MATLPYVLSYKNLPTLFEKINTAKIPETGFTHKFLLTTIGLKSTSDRAYIPLLRSLGFLDQSNIPTASYRLLKGGKRKAALADGIRRAYGPLFDADQDANKLTGEKLKTLAAQIAGTDSDLTGRISGTFAALVNLADFETTADGSESKRDENADDDDLDETAAKDDPRGRLRGLRTEFHYNIQVQLPSNGTEETYLNTFNAIRKTFQ